MHPSGGGGGSVADGGARVDVAAASVVDCTRAYWIAGLVAADCIGRHCAECAINHRLL